MKQLGSDFERWLATTPLDHLRASLTTMREDRNNASRMAEWDYRYEQDVTEMDAKIAATSSRVYLLEAARRGK